MVSSAVGIDAAGMGSIGVRVGSTGVGVGSTGAGPTKAGAGSAGAGAANESGPEVTSPIAGTITPGGVVRIVTGSSISAVDGVGGLGGPATACASVDGDAGTNASMGSKGLTDTTGSSETDATVAGSSIDSRTSSSVGPGAGVVGTTPVSTTESHERRGSFERAPSGGTMQSYRHATRRA